MSFKYLKQMPTPEEVKRELPLPEKYQKLKKERDAVISDIITGKDDRFLVIIGPCSADNEDAVCDYVNRLTAVQERWPTGFTSSRGSTPTNPAPPDPAIKASPPSRIPQRLPTWWKA